MNAAERMGFDAGIALPHTIGEIQALKLELLSPQDAQAVTKEAFQAGDGERWLQGSRLVLRIARQRYPRLRTQRSTRRPAAATAAASSIGPAVPQGNERCGIPGDCRATTASGRDTVGAGAGRISYRPDGTGST